MNERIFFRIFFFEAGILNSCIDETQLWQRILKEHT